MSAILRALTRYSANDLQFPVNDRSLFTGSLMPPNGPAMELGEAPFFERMSLRAGWAKTGYGGTPDLVAEASRTTIWYLIRFVRRDKTETVNSPAILQRQR